MRPILFILTFASVFGLAFWAYHENYATQRTLSRVEALQSEISSLREALTLQRAEWAYLNRPDRLRLLADANFDRLGLLPLEPTQFGLPAQVSHPAPKLPFITNPVDVIGMQSQTQDFP
jgi:hypothetical protein